jgi:hypothetical protein
MRGEVLAAHPRHRGIDDQARQRASGLRRGIDGRHHHRQDPRQPGQQAIPDEAQRCRVVARQPGTGDEARIVAVHDQRSATFVETRRRDAALQLVDEPQVAELAVHVGEPAVEGVAARTAGRGERVEIVDRRLRHAGMHLRIVHARRHHDDACRRVRQQAAQQ